MLVWNSLSSFREGNRLEAKEAQLDLPRSLWETYSAFANTDGGVVLLGVKELADKTLLPIGLPDPERTVQKFWNGVNNPSNVSRNVLVNADVEIVELDGMRVVSITVPRASAADKPVYLKGNPFGHTYRRNGEGDYRCTDEEVRAMIRDSGDGRGDGLVLDELGMDALCDETVDAYRNVLAAVRPRHPWIDLPREELLFRLQAVGKAKVDDQLHPTCAGLLAFGWGHRIAERFPTYFLEYREVTESRKWDDRFTSGDGDWSGNVFDFWRRASTQLTASLPKPYATQGMNRVDDTPMHAALREGLANMLLHADYYGSVSCVCVRYEDRATFMNPGVPLISTEEAMAGGLSSARNPALMKMFNLVGVGEKAGSGFDTMRAGCSWADVEPPLLSEAFAPDRTMLSMGVPHGFAAAPRAASNTPGHDARAGVLAMLSRDDSVSRSAVEAELGIGRTTAATLLGSLVREGLAVKEGAGPSTTYRLAR